MTRVPEPEPGLYDLVIRLSNEQGSTALTLRGVSRKTLLACPLVSPVVELHDKTIAPRAREGE